MFLGLGAEPGTRGVELESELLRGLPGRRRLPASGRSPDYDDREAHAAPGASGGSAGGSVRPNFRSEYSLR